MSRRVLSLSFVLAVFLAALNRHGSTVVAAAQQPSVQETNDRFVQSVRASLAGKETEAAETVFKNIQIFKGGARAGHSGNHERGVQQSVGVTCERCHVTDNFASEEKRPKLHSEFVEVEPRCLMIRDAGAVR